MKKILSFFLICVVSACYADKCTDCGRETWSSATRCSNCAKNRSEADAKGQVMGQAMVGLFGMMAAQQKEENARRDAAEAARKKEIQQKNEEIIRQLAILELHDVDEGRHNLGIQLLPVPSTYPIQYLSGKAADGSLTLSGLPPKLFDTPVKFYILKKELPGSVDLMIVRQSSSQEASGSWKIKNVPFKFFYRNATTLRMEIKLISEDELLFSVKSFPENKNLLKVTLVKNTPFDYAHEVGVDGNGLTSKTYTRGLGTPSSKNTKRKGLSW